MKQSIYYIVGIHPFQPAEKARLSAKSVASFVLCTLLAQMYTLSSFPFPFPFTSFPSHVYFRIWFRARRLLQHVCDEDGGDRWKVQGLPRVFLRTEKN